jgi:hypothetical protein
LTPHFSTPHKHPYSQPSVNRPNKTSRIPNHLLHSLPPRPLLSQRRPPCKHTSPNSVSPSNRTSTSSPTAYIRSSNTATRLTALPIVSSAPLQNDSTSGIAKLRNGQVQTALGLAIYCAASRVCLASHNEHLCFLFVALSGHCAVSFRTVWSGMAWAQAHHLSKAGVGLGMNDICCVASFTSFLVHESAVRVDSFSASWKLGFSRNPVSAGRWERVHLGFAGRATHGSTRSEFKTWAGCR